MCKNFNDPFFLLFKITWSFECVEDHMGIFLICFAPILQVSKNEELV